MTPEIGLNPQVSGRTDERRTTVTATPPVRSPQPGDRLGHDLELVAFARQPRRSIAGEFVLAGERHRMLTEALTGLLPQFGLTTHGCGHGLGQLSATLNQHERAGLLLIQPSRGLLAAVREQSLYSVARPLAVICSPSPGRFYLREVLLSKARAVFSATATVEELVDGFAELVAGRTVIHRDLLADLRFDARGGIEIQPKDDLLSLTRRQLEVVRLTAIGCSTRDIGERLGLAPKTVESHRYRAMRKLNLHDRVELTRTALSDGLLR